MKERLLCEFLASLPEDMRKKARVFTATTKAEHGWNTLKSHEEVQIRPNLLEDQIFPKTLVGVRFTMTCGSWRDAA